MAPGSSFSGRSGDSFPEQRLVMKPTRRPAVVFLLRVVCSCGPAMSGIVKVIVSFFRKSEEVAIERHRSRVPADKEKHEGFFELKKKKSNRKRYVDDIFSCFPCGTLVNQILRLTLSKQIHITLYYQIYGRNLCH